jgi:hypothetical protein
MGIFSSISEAIFGRPAQARGIGEAAAQSAGADAGASWWQQAAQQGGGGAVSETDVEAQLETRAQSHGETLNWRTSIVDLMKLTGIDPSLQNRKELAQELGYTGDMNDSASMNVWLHRQVMRELAANGGRVPSNLTD